jgi:hypothetical protein
MALMIVDPGADAETRGQGREGIGGGEKLNGVTQGGLVDRRTTCLDRKPKGET